MSCLADRQHLECDRCPLYSYRKQVVPGHGNVLARIMLVGEAPGADEDREGIPFVGKAGQKLDTLIALAGLSHDDLFISNIVHCRPPNNDLRQFAGSVLTCPSYWLSTELDIVRPRVVVALGVTAGSYFFPGLVTAHDMAGTRRIVERKDWRFVAIGSYHPSYVLKSRNPAVERSIVAVLQAAGEES